MRRLLLAAGTVLVLAAPAFAQSTVTIEKRTITKEEPAAGSTVSTVIIAPTAPPAPEAETPPPPPGPTLVWTPGHWRWNPDKQNYTWVSGKYIEPPRAHAGWIPGRWRQEPGGWVWEEGRWN